MSSAAPQGFRRTVVLKSPLAERLSRDPALTNRPPNQGNSVPAVDVVVHVGTQRGVFPDRIPPLPRKPEEDPSPSGIREVLSEGLKPSLPECLPGLVTGHDRRAQMIGGQKRPDLVLDVGCHSIDSGAGRLSRLWYGRL